MAHEFYTQDNEGSHGIDRFTRRNTKALVSSISLGAVSLVLDTSYNLYSSFRYRDREITLRQRIANGARNVGNHVLSGIGAEYKPGTFAVDPNGAGGYVVRGADFSGLEPASVQAQSPLEQPDTPSVNQVQTGQDR